MTMHHGYNQDMVLLHGKQDGVRENFGKTPPDIGFNYAVILRVIEQATNGLFNAVDESQIEVVLPGCVELNGLLVFHQGFRMEIKSHRPTERRT